MHICKAVALVAAIGTLAGCQYAPDMLDRTLSYNRAVAQSTNQVLLLNIVRAAERLPTYYTRLEGDASSLALTPSAGLSLPLTNQHSFENDLNTGATGALASGATKSVSALASLAGTLGLQASESNLLTLQNLDDQKYQNGMMTPVALKNIAAFQDEGYQRDLLFMMFVSSIQVSKTLLTTIDSAVTARCTEVATEPGSRAGGISFTRQICAYISSNPYRGLFNSGAGDFSLATCQATGGAVTDDPPSEMVHFNNDPAREGRRGSASDPHPAVCFQILLNDLLVLGLKIGSAQDVPAELVDAVPDAVAQNPKFRTEMIQQNLFVRQAANGISAICKKKSQDNIFTLTFSNPESKQALAKPIANLQQQLGVPESASATPKPPPTPPPPPPAKRGAPAPAAAPGVTAPAAIYPAEPLAACQQKNPGQPPSAKDSVLASDDNVDADLKGAPKPIKLTSDKMTFSTRSFQAMIYYLGETLRYEEDKDADPVTFPRILGRNPAVAGSTYYETMFYGSSHLDSDDVAVSVHDDSGVAFGLPKPCVSGAPGLSSERQVNCTAEYPDNESLQLLNFVNQVWGLQKESVAAPSSPLVVVSPQ